MLIQEEVQMTMVMTLMKVKTVKEMSVLQVLLVGLLFPLEKRL
jgi:hypothetical protein